jgi:hypothetical protein
MQTLLIGWYITCIGSNFAHKPKCYQELRDFQYALQIHELTDSYIPFKTEKDKFCTELPESCSALELVKQLIELIDE